jgi:preprotein translocase subunit SecD
MAAKPACIADVSGLDLRGVHFLMQVDTKAVLNKRVQGMQSTIKSVLREKEIRYAGIARDGDAFR